MKYSSTLLYYPFRKQSIAETLHCSGDLRFLGNPFPERLLEMKNLRKVPKPSKPWTYELLVFRNMTARLQNIIKPRFWKLWWTDWVCAGIAKEKNSFRRKLRYISLIVWLPVSFLLTIPHVIPVFSAWANYMRSYVKSIFCASDDMSKLHRIARVMLLLLQLIGVVMLYLILWNLLVRSK